MNMLGTGQCIAVHSKLHCPHFTLLESVTVSTPRYTDLASAACGQPVLLKGVTHDVTELTL